MIENRGACPPPLQGSMSLLHLFPSYRAMEAALAAAKDEIAWLRNRLEFSEQRYVHATEKAIKAREQMTDWITRGRRGPVFSEATEADKDWFEDAQPVEQSVLTARQIVQQRQQEFERQIAEAFEQQRAQESQEPVQRAPNRLPSEAEVQEIRAFYANGH